MPFRSRKGGIGLKCNIFLRIAGGLLLAAFVGTGILSGTQAKYAAAATAVAAARVAAFGPSASVTGLENKTILFRNDHPNDKTTNVGYTYDNTVSEVAVQFTPQAAILGAGAGSLTTLPPAKAVAPSASANADSAGVITWLRDYPFIDQTYNNKTTVYTCADANGVTSTPSWSWPGGTTIPGGQSPWPYVWEFDIACTGYPLRIYPYWSNTDTPTGRQGHNYLVEIYQSGTHLTLQLWEQEHAEGGASYYTAAPRLELQRAGIDLDSGAHVRVEYAAQTVTIYMDGMLVFYAHNPRMLNPAPYIRIDSVASYSISNVVLYNKTNPNNNAAGHSPLTSTGYYRTADSSAALEILAEQID